MFRRLLFGVLSLTLFAASARADTPTPAPSPTHTPTGTPTATPTKTATPTITPTPVPWIAEQRVTTEHGPTFYLFGTQPYQLILTFIDEPAYDFNMTVRFYDYAPYGVQGPVMNGYWEILTDIPSPPFNATGFFSYSDTYFADMNDSIVQGAGRGENVKWSFKGGIPNRVNNYVVVPEITAFSNWTLGPASSFTDTLPSMGFWGVVLTLAALTITLKARAGGSVAQSRQRHVDKN